MLDITGLPYSYLLIESLAHGTSSGGTHEARAVGVAILKTVTAFSARLARLTVPQLAKLVTFLALATVMWSISLWSPQPPPPGPGDSHELTVPEIWVGLSQWEAFEELLAFILTCWLLPIVILKLIRTPWQSLVKAFKTAALASLWAAVVLTPLVLWKPNFALYLVVLAILFGSDYIFHGFAWLIVLLPAWWVARSLDMPSRTRISRISVYVALLFFVVCARVLALFLSVLGG